MAFADLNDNMKCAEEYLKYCVEWALQNCRSDIEWFEKNIEEGLITRLKNVLSEPFARITYTEAIDVLEVLYIEALNNHLINIRVVVITTRNITLSILNANGFCFFVFFVNRKVLLLLKSVQPGVWIWGQSTNAI